MSPNPLQDLLDFLSQLDQAGIYFRLDRVRDEAIMVRIDIPGERWEVEYFADGEIEIERFGVMFENNESIVSRPESRQLLQHLLDESNN